MTEGQSGGQSSDVSSAELRQDIERTRQQLGETVEALAAKADVKSRAREKVDQVKEQVTARASQAREQATARASQAREQAASRASQARQQATADDGRSNQAALAAAVAAVVLTCVAIVLWRRR
jgi:hypothetical protein